MLVIIFDGIFYSNIRHRTTVLDRNLLDRKQFRSFSRVPSYHVINQGLISLLVRYFYCINYIYNHNQFVKNK